MTSSSVLSVERDAHVATVWLDRPAQLNAMGPAFWDDLPVVMQELGEDPDVRAVVIAGRGKHFTVMPYPARSHALSEGSNTTIHFYGLLTRYLEDNL